LTLNGFIGAKLIVGVGCIVGAYMVLTRLYGWMRPRLDLALTTTLLKKSLPFAIITAVDSIHDRIDRVMLERILGDDGRVATALYDGAYRWFDAFQMFLWTVLPIFFARFALHQTDYAEQSRLLTFGQRITALPLMFVSICIWFFGEKLLFLFTHSTAIEIAIMTDTLKILAIVLYINAFAAIFSTLMTSTGHENIATWLTLSAIALNILLNAIFIPRYGTVAAAWATAVSYSCMQLAYMLYTHFRLPVRLPIRQMMYLFVASAVAAATIYIVSSLQIVWYVCVATSGVVYLLIATLLKLIPDVRFLRTNK
jgi:O-antigen/teichoic acid export membrane protein